MSEESIENITKSDNNFVPTFVDHHLLPHININGHCLIKNNISITKTVKYISYTLAPQLKNLNTDFTLSNCLFGSYSGYGIGFDSRSKFSLSDGSV